MIDKSKILERERIERIAAYEGGLSSILTVYSIRKVVARHYLRVNPESTTDQEIKRLLYFYDNMILDALALPKHDCAHEFDRPIINANNRRCIKCGIWE